VLFCPRKCRLRPVLSTPVPSPQVREPGKVSRDLLSKRSRTVEGLLAALTDEQLLYKVRPFSRHRTVRTAARGNSRTTALSFASAQIRALVTRAALVWQRATRHVIVWALS
jgi:hypothetical protein